jgi:glutathione S-transferase
LLHSSHANTSTRTLIPKLEDLRGMARFEEAASLEVTGFDPVANKLVLEQYFKPLFGIEKDEKIVKSLFDQLITKLDGIDRVLEMREFMGGDVSGGVSFSSGLLVSVPPSQFSRWKSDLVLPAISRTKDGADLYVGQEFSLMDIFYVPYMSKLVELSEEVLDGRDHLRAWWGRAVDRESVRAIMKA